jgi:regulatory protein
VKGAGGEAGRVRLSDGSSFILHGEVIARAGIAAGTSLDSDTISSLQRRSEIVFARESALGLLSRAPHTRRGLAVKLRARGFPEEAVRAAIARMLELGYLDDRAFAENWARSRLAARREGWSAIYVGLLRRGVPRKIAEEAAADACTDEVEIEKARSLARGLAPRAAARALKSRGFRSRTIARVLREMRSRGREEAEG